MESARPEPTRPGPHGPCARCQQIYTRKSHARVRKSSGSLGRSSSARTAPASRIRLTRRSRAARNGVHSQPPSSARSPANWQPDNSDQQRPASSWQLESGSCMGSVLYSRRCQARAMLAGHCRDGRATPSSLCLLLLLFVTLPTALASSLFIPPSAYPRKLTSRACPWIVYPRAVSCCRGACRAPLDHTPDSHTWLCPRTERESCLSSVYRSSTRRIAFCFPPRVYKGVYCACGGSCVAAALPSRGAHNGVTGCKGFAPREQT